MENIFLNNKYKYCYILLYKEQCKRLSNEEERKGRLSKLFFVSHEAALPKNRPGFREGRMHRGEGITFSRYLIKFYKQGIEKLNLQSVSNTVEKYFLFEIISISTHKKVLSGSINQHHSFPLKAVGIKALCKSSAFVRTWISGQQKFANRKESSYIEASAGATSSHRNFN